MIAPSLGSLDALLREFPDDKFYVSRDAALQAYGDAGMFNVIDFESGWKVDFILRKSRPFSIAEFDRRRTVDLLGTTLSVASPEDVLIAKLEWAQLSESERQIEDVAGIVRTQAMTSTLLTSNAGSTPSVSLSNGKLPCPAARQQVVEALAASSTKKRQ